MRIFIKANDFEFIFASAPSVYGTWWDDPINKDTPTISPNHADTSINYLDNFIQQNGPFYGILGYSQGLAMAIVYLAYRNITFQKVILFNGYLPTTHQGLMNTINQNSPFQEDTLIFLGGGVRSGDRAGDKGSTGVAACGVTTAGGLASRAAGASTVSFSARTWAAVTSPSSPSSHATL